VFSLFVVLFIFNVFYFKKDKYSLLLALLLPTLFNDIVDSAFMEDFQDLSRYYIFLIPIISFYGVMIYQTIVNRKKLTNKELLLAVAIYFITMLPSFMNTLNMYNSLLESIIYLNTIIIFLYFCSSAKIKKEDFFLVLILFALQGIMQMTSELLAGDTLHMIATKDIGVGWSKQNNLAQYAAFALPFVLFFASKYSKVCKYLYYFVAVLFVVSVFVTSARTTILSLIVIFIPMMSYLYKNTPKKELKRNGLILLSFVVVTLLILTLTGVTGTFINRMFDVGLDSTYRVAHWKLSVDHFKDFPLFGSGILTTSEYIYLLPSYHNVFVDALTNTGIIGFLGTVYLCYVLVKQLFSNKQNFILGMSLLILLIASLLDTAHLNPITLMMMFISFKFIEPKKTEI
jgi:O-antigen ligase